MGRRLRIVAALGFALATTVLLIQPAAAARMLAETGNPGYYELYDEMTGRRGANCIYEAGSSDLDKITVRPPQMHGAYMGMTKVEWRFKVRRNPPGSGTPFVTIYTSSWQSDRANDAVPADDFTRRTWTAPENPTGFFQILVELRWWYQGNVDGFARWQYEWYKAKWTNQSYVNNEYCLEDF